MALFEKKYCPFCNNKIGMFDKVVLSNGYCCKACYGLKSQLLVVNPKKISVEYFSNHLAERSKNAVLLERFNPDLIFGENIKVYIDTKMGAFVISDATENINYGNFKYLNPDIFFFANINTVSPEIAEHTTEIRYYDSRKTNDLGAYEYKCFNPRVYAFSYDFYVNIVQKHEYANSCRIHLNRRIPVDNGQPTEIDICRTNRFSLSDYFSFKRPYKAYRGKTTNQDDVKRSEKYVTFDLMLSEVIAAFRQNMENPVPPAIVDAPAPAPVQAAQPVVQAAPKSPVNTQLYESYAKFSIGCFVARADGSLNPHSKEDLDAMFLDIYEKNNKKPAVKQELLKIYNMPNISFIYLEKYLREVDVNRLASYLMVAEEIASADGVFSEKEKMRIQRIRQYIADRSGNDRLSNPMDNIDTSNLRCPGCSALMEVILYNNVAECPFCGNRVPLQKIE